ncbi:MAG: glycosyltransferase family 2 protein [Solirubrobacterales bacterium]
MDLSFCVVNTAGRAHLLRCLDSIRDTLPRHLEAEVLVLDNASGDGSVEAVRAWNESEGGLGGRLRLIALDRRKGKAENDSLLLKEAKGEWCLLLNEDSELCPGAVEALLRAVETEPNAAVAGAQLLGPDGSRSACAWRLPGVGAALAQAFFLHRIFVTQSGRGPGVHWVGWVQSAAMMVRRSAAAEVGYFDPEFFVYSDETDFQKRLHDAGWLVLHVPAALAVHHEQLTNDRASGERRAVEFHRNRDLYMRKHHGPGAAAAVRWLTAFNYVTRALLALALPGQDAAWFRLHARLALRPRGEGIREGAAKLNARLDREAA